LEYIVGIRVGQQVFRTGEGLATCGLRLAEEEKTQMTLMVRMAQMGEKA
jgi:hypothetical protein